MRYQPKTSPPTPNFESASSTDGKRSRESPLKDTPPVRQSSLTKRDRKDSFVNEILLENRFINNAIEDEMIAEHADDNENSRESDSDDITFDAAELRDRRHTLDSVDKVKSILKKRKSQDAESIANSTPQFLTPQGTPGKFQGKTEETAINVPEKSSKLKSSTQSVNIELQKLLKDEDDDDNNLRILYKQ